MFILFLQSMKHESNDVKALGAQCTGWISRGQTVPLDIAKSLTIMLIMGTKEKNTLVRSNSESALARLLRVREDSTMMQVRHSGYYISGIFYVLQS